MALSRFWLLNGCKKKGKKSTKKVAKRIKHKTITKSAKKSVKKLKRNPITKTVKEKEIIFKPTIVKHIPATIMTEEEKIKYNRGKSMKKGRRKIARASQGKHLITTFASSKGTLRTSSKSKLAKRGIKLNPMKISTKGIVNQLKPAVVLGATSVGTVYGINKFMPKIPYVNTVSNAYAKAGLKIALGLLASMGVKKVWKKQQAISNGLLVGSVISALMDFINVSDTASTTAGIKLNGVKVLGNALSFGRPKTPLANPNFQMNGLKLPNKNLSAIKFAKNYNATNNNTVAGERY